MNIAVFSSKPYDQRFLESIAETTLGDIREIEQTGASRNEVTSALLKG